MWRKKYDFVNKKENHFFHKISQAHIQLVDIKITFQANTLDNLKKKVLMYFWNKKCYYKNSSLIKTKISIVPWTLNALVNLIMNYIFLSWTVLSVTK